MVPCANVTAGGSAMNLERTDSASGPATANPWGVTFDDWGNHGQSSDLRRSFHALDPAYPE